MKRVATNVGCRVRGVHVSTATSDPTASNLSVVDERLANRLRLGDNWQRLGLVAKTGGITAAYDALLGEERLSQNETQAAAATALSALPDSLGKARYDMQRWLSGQARRTDTAKQASERVQRRREAAAARPKGGWLTSAPEAPAEPEVVGPMCWLDLGPPPVLKPAGCYLHGTVGSGKSTVMDIFSLFGRGSWRVRRQHFHEFSLWLHERLHRIGGPSADEPHSHVIARIADEVAQLDGGTDILCLDEFAVTNVADAAIFTEILRLLGERHVAVVCTTNRPPEELYKDGLHRDHYMPALIDRFRENFLVVEVRGADYREQLYYQGLVRQEETNTVAQPVFVQGGDFNSALHAALSHDTAGVPDLTPGTIQIAWGRSLAVPGFGAGVARFHFDDLCRTPLSAEDFLHLATSVHTVFVHNIPQLSIEEHNEARRFTNLVDVLYEHSVRLVCHSEVPCEAVLAHVEALRDASDETDAERLGVFQTQYDDTPNFQLQIKEAGSREKWLEMRDRRDEERHRAETQQIEAQRLRRLESPDAADGDAGSGWSAAPATADLSAPQHGVAGVMVAAVGSLQESGFAARRAISRLKEMQTQEYLDASHRRRESMSF